MKTKIKNFFNGIWKILKIIGRFISKCVKTVFNYIKENEWLQPLVIVALIFALVFSVQGIVSGTRKLIDRIHDRNNETEQYTVIKMVDLKARLNAGEDFVFYIGYDACSACDAYNTAVNKYVQSTGNIFYYLDIGKEDGVYIDYTLATIDLEEIMERLSNIPNQDEFIDLDSLSTPTTVVVRGGEFAAAKVGAFGINGASDYSEFADFVDGKDLP